METVLITGGTGLIGTALTQELLKNNFKVIILTRSPKEGKGNLRYAEWNLNSMSIDRNAIENADYIIHLAGANVAEKRWTEKRKTQIRESRTKSGELIVKSLKEIPNKVKAVVSASAIGWYGPDAHIPNPKPFAETDPPADDFLGNTSVHWEKAITPVKEIGKRLVILRTGIVLSKEGGAYAEFRKPLQFRVATILGDGKQVISWIHIDDLVKLYMEVLRNENYEGVYNAVAPEPVSNKDLMQTIGATRDKLYICLKVPQIFLKIALGEMSIEVLKSTTVSSKKLEATGFTFQYPSIEEAIQKLEAS